MKNTNDSITKLNLLCDSLFPSRPGLSNLRPAGRMHHTLTTPTPGLVKSKKPQYDDVNIT